MATYPADDNSLASLSRREQQILEFVADGWSANQVARLIQLAPRTVERHIENIRLKMHARNSPHMVKQAYSNGILSVPMPISAQRG